MKCYQCTRDMTGEPVHMRSLDGDPICKSCIDHINREKNPMNRFDSHEVEIRREGAR